MRLITVTVRDPEGNRLPDAVVSGVKTDHNGRAMVLIGLGATAKISAPGYRSTNLIVTGDAEIILLPERITIKGKSDRRDRKAWLLISLGLMGILLHGESEPRAVDIIRRRNMRRTGLLAIGKLNLDQWQRDMAEDLNRLYTHVAMLACPNTEEAIALANGIAGEPPGWRFSMSRLYDFARDIGKGDYSNMMSRAAMYADSARGVYEMVAQDSLPDEEGVAWQVRSVMTKAEHCPDCVRFAAKGWQPKGSIPPPQVGRRCRTNCRCRLEFRRVPQHAMV